MDTSPAGIRETNEAVETALARATLYSAIALGFRAPTVENIARLTAAPGSPWLVEAATILDTDAAYGLRSAIEALPIATSFDIAVLTSLHVALFGHTARGAVPPYETEYGNEALFQQPQELSDLMGFYRAFGLTVNIREYERPDHIRCECEFLSFLALKEAYALEHKDAEMLDETRKAQRLFMKDHLGRFLPTFAYKLSREDGAGLYGKLADFSLRLVTHGSARLNIPMAGSDLPLRPAEDDRVPMACASGTECMAMPGACEPDSADSV